MGSHVLVTRFKPSWNVLGRVQLVLLTATGVPGVLGLSVLKHVEYQEEPF